MIKPPYPYFGGKGSIAAEVWKRLGNVPLYVEPFLGGGSVWLSRPDVRSDHQERLNDADGFIANFWRAVQKAPEEVAQWTDYPSFENDLHARHAWLVKQAEGLVTRLEGDPHYYDAKIAGWWVWGIALWIGSEWCSGRGKWTQQDGLLVPRSSPNEPGVNRQRPHQGDRGRGVNRQSLDNLLAYFETFQNRMHKGVVVNCGDWTRLMKPAVLWGMNEKEPVMSGVFLDPPYPHDERDMVYSHDNDVDAKVVEWCVKNGGNPHLRIAYCTYRTYRTPEKNALFNDLGWTPLYWKTNGGYGNNAEGRGRDNKAREVVYFSPFCLYGDQTQQMSLLT